METLSPDVDESPWQDEDPFDYTIRMAREKSLSLINRLPGEGDLLLVTSDTTVTADNLILGKPADIDQAREYLAFLSGREHSVVTGLTLAWRTDCTWNVSTGLEETRVRFQELDARTVETYLSRVQWADKAGGYAIQEEGDLIIDSIEGSLTNVIGFPLRRFYAMIVELGLAEKILTHRVSGAT
jgi:septum formation protein